MKNSTKRYITLAIVLVLIAALILYFQSTKPKIDTSQVQADINIENLTTLTANQSSSGTVHQLTEADRARIELKSTKYERAKELVNPDGYINVKNITISEYIGKKVILVDFWTYSCINCQRTIPYLEAWYEKYKDYGFILIGVHTPEFDFEKDYNNVKDAVNRFGITYPVVQDNEYMTWRAYNNRYWPRKYLIDIDGFIVYDHIGEGAYEEAEKMIQEALQERSDVLGLNESIPTGIVNPSVEASSPGSLLTPEIYFGYNYSRGQIGNEQGWHPGQVIDYTYPETLEPSKFYLNGSWLNNNDNMELVSDNGGIKLGFHAMSVNIVASADKEVSADIYVDGQFEKTVMIKDAKLYNIVSFDSVKRSVLEIRSEKGLRAYTFTFG